MSKFGHMTRKIWMLPVAAMAVVAVALALPFGGAASAQGVVKSVHEDWQIRCQTPAGAQTEQCALFSRVVAEDRANVGITVMVLKSADQKARLLRVLVPEKILLPPGLGLTIDEVNVGKIPYRTCGTLGCLAEVGIDDALLKQLSTGTTATFIIYLDEQEGVGFPVSLKGFATGYDKLK